MTNKFFVLVYLCDATDGRARERQALFTKWHRGMADTIDHHPVKIKVEDDVIYGGLFKNKDFPHTDVLEGELIDNASGFIVQKFGQQEL